VTTPTIVPLPDLVVEPIVRAALAEDLGRAGDVTTEAVIPTDAKARAKLVARAEGRIAGLQCARLAFHLIDPSLKFSISIGDGSDTGDSYTVATIEGPARGLLTGERVALNFVGHLSGVATATRALVRAVAGTKAKITCTRKTTPGLRQLEKYAVRCGGGTNHRFGLDDAILIKDNHIAAAGGIAPALKRAKAAAGHMMRIEIEVDSLAQLEEALANGADAVLLDNMTPDLLRQAVKLNIGRAALEASGGVTLSTVRAIAETGIDYISSGAITHSAPSLDVALDF
jgi:nicotinate-nucleotide pyrophosphorylase (carboxylating)